MTAPLRRHTDAADAAQRYAAIEAGREREQLDAVSVLLVVKAKIEAGELEAAKAIVKAYREGTL
jgi:hypothetical protein